MGNKTGPAPKDGFAPPFAIGAVIGNRELYTTFKCACEGGIRYSSAYHILVLVSNFVDPRHRGGTWRDNVLYFAGTGKSGDQDIEKGANKRLDESLRAAIPIYYFEVHEQGRYVYRGLVHSAGQPFQKEEPGADGKNRKIWIFPLRLDNS